MQNVLEVNRLVKQYGTFRAVDEISFSVSAGKVVGFLGPNGAGKTTTIQMLLGITQISSGSIAYFGKDFFTHRQACLQSINFASAFNTLMGRISVIENLLVYAGLYALPDPKKKIYELANYFTIESLLSDLYQNLSAGQKTRVNLVKALLNDPKLILMDEPTASLDPDISDKVLTLIEQLKRDRNLSILYTSHNMSEITRICDEVIFLDHGKIVAQDTPSNLTKRVSAARLRLVFRTGKQDLIRFLKEHTYSFSFVTDHLIVIDTKETAIPQLLFGIAKAGVYITDIVIEKPTLEDVFLQIARG